MRRLTGALACILMAAALTPPPTSATESPALEVRLRAAIRKLPVATEHRAGYDRDKFAHWVDTDRDCRNTRDEVLAAESRIRVRGCDVRRGRWVSYYDGRTWTRASDVDIDHLVPLAEAWDSGAWNWTARTRKAFANDLRYRPTLVAVTDNVNQAKSDQDFRDWQPKLHACRYLREWVGVKLRWRLSVDEREKPFITGFAKACPNPILRVPLAAVSTKAPAEPDPADPEPAEPPPAAVVISRILYNPEGDESQAPNGEYAAITNNTESAVTLTGWSLSDETTETYTFSDFTLDAGATVRVRSGAGTDTATDVYADWGARWSNDGDTGTLYDAAGTVVDTCSYEPTESGYTDCPD